MARKNKILMKIMCSCFFSLFESLSCFFIVCGVQQKLRSTRAHKKIDFLPNFRLTSCSSQILSTFNHFQISYFSCGACPRDKCPSSCRMRCRYCKGVCEGQVSNPSFVRHDLIDSHWILEMCLHPGKRVGQLPPVGAKCYINN